MQFTLNFFLMRSTRLGGIMSVFLMGCYDEDHDNWVTVTKVRALIEEVV